jgi:hypothetical protein
VNLIRLVPAKEERSPQGMQVPVPFNADNDTFT